LLAADSPRVKKVEQDLPILRLRLIKGSFHISFPGNCVCHDRSSLGCYTVLHADIFVDLFSAE